MVISAYNSNIANNAIIAETAVIEDGVEIGEGCTISDFAIIRSGVKIGKNCKIFPHAVIGEGPQDKSFSAEESFVEIGDNNVIREFVTIHKAVGPQAKTIIGNDNYLMVGVHVAHNCEIGNNNTLANYTNLAGHVQLGNYITIGGSANIHQHCRIGDYVMVSGLCGVNHDLLPYMMYGGIPAGVITTNRYALKKAGMSQLTRSQLMNAFKIIYNKTQSVPRIVERLETEVQETEEIKHLIKFIKESKRGFAMGKLES